MKVIINGEIKEIDEPDLFVKGNDMWYVRTKNVDREILNELENFLKEKFEAINTIKSMLGDNVKILNPDIKGIEMAYKDIQDKIQELKEKYK